MTPKQGWTPSPAPAGGLISAPGLFRRHIRHRVPYGAAPLRLDGRHAADLGWAARYVVMALCGCPCSTEVVDGAAEPREECPNCWRLARTAADPAGTPRTPRNESVDDSPAWPSEPPDAVSRPAAAHPQPVAAPQAHQPIRRRQLIAEPEARGDAACIAAIDARDVHLPIMAANHAA